MNAMQSKKINGVLLILYFLEPLHITFALLFLCYRGTKSIMAFHYIFINASPYLVYSKTSLLEVERIEKILQRSLYTLIPSLLTVLSYVRTVPNYNIRS